MRVSSGPGGLRNSELWIVDLCLLQETRPPWVTETLSHRDPTLSQDFHVHHIWVQLWPLGRDLAFEKQGKDKSAWQLWAPFLLAPVSPTAHQDAYLTRAALVAAFLRG